MSGVDPLPLVGALVLAALLGSIPFGVIIARGTSGIDLRRVGSGNIGATNVLRALGPLAAIATLLLDLGKGAAAVLIAHAIGSLNSGVSDPETQGFLQGPAAFDLAGVAAVAGHVFSPWLGFKGGKGVATAAGVMIVLSIPLTIVGLVAFVVVLASTRIVSLASIVAVSAVMIAAIVLSAAPSRIMTVASPPSLAVLIPISALILLRHVSNIGRLVHGKEPPIRSRRRTGEPQQ